MRISLRSALARGRRGAGLAERRDVLRELGFLVGRRVGMDDPLRGDAIKHRRHLLVQLGRLLFLLRVAKFLDQVSHAGLDHPVARALARGGGGDRIRVMNIASRSTVSGVIAPDGTVTVEISQ